MNIKRTLFLLIGFSCILNISSALDRSREFRFDADRYFLAFSNKDKADAYVNEYIREGETLDNWQKLIGVYYFPTNAPPQTAVQKLSEVVKRSDPGADVRIIDTDNKNEAMIDFFVKSRTNPMVEEYDIFRYARSADGKGLMTYQFALRCYGNQAIEEFKKNTADKQKWIKQVMNSDFPALVKDPYGPQK